MGVLTLVVEVTAAMARAMAAGLGAVLGFGTGFVAADGRDRRGPLSGLAASRFEDALSV